MAMMGMAPVFPRSSVRPDTVDGPVGGCPERHWPSLPTEKMVSLCKETSEGFLHALSPALCALPAAWVAPLSALGSSRRHRHSFCQGQHRLIPLSEHPCSSTGSSEAMAGTNRMPEVPLRDQAFLTAFISASSCNPLCFWEVGAKSKQLVFSWTRLKKKPSPHMCGAGIFVAVWNCLDQRANLQLSFADVQYLCQPKPAKRVGRKHVRLLKTSKGSITSYEIRNKHNKNQINLIKILSVAWLSLSWALKVNQIPPDDSCMSFEEAAIKDNWLKSLHAECAQTLLQSSKMWVG